VVSFFRWNDANKRGQKGGTSKRSISPIKEEVTPIATEESTKKMRRRLIKGITCYQSNRGGGGNPRRDLERIHEELQGSKEGITDQQLHMKKTTTLLLISAGKIEALKVRYSPQKSAKSDADDMVVDTKIAIMVESEAGDM
ncbi:hypothetical protein ACLOJK_041829, partial [Asimina triloba]